MGQTEGSRRCPVCRAKFRGTVTCSRCGADLTPLMILEVRAWQLRREARRHLLDGHLDSATRVATGAQRLRATARGARLLRLSTTLQRA